MDGMTELGHFRVPPRLSQGEFFAGPFGFDHQDIGLRQEDDKIGHAGLVLARGPVHPGMDVLPTRPLGIAIVHDFTVQFFFQGRGGRGGARRSGAGEAGLHLLELELTDSHFS